MDEGTIHRLAFVTAYQAEIYAVCAEIDAMKASNEARQQRGLAQAYDTNDFVEKAADLQSIADRLRRDF